MDKLKGQKFSPRELEKVMSEKNALKLELASIKGLIKKFGKKDGSKAKSEKQFLKEQKKQVEERLLRLAQMEAVIREGVRLQQLQGP